MNDAIKFPKGKYMGIMRYKKMGRLFETILNKTIRNSSRCGSVSDEEQGEVRNMAKYWLENSFTFTSLNLSILYTSNWLDPK